MPDYSGPLTKNETVSQKKNRPPMRKRKEDLCLPSIHRVADKALLGNPLSPGPIT